MIAGVAVTSMGGKMQLNWTGPFQIQAYLDNAITKSKVWESRWPPAGNAVYLVSRSAWRRTPNVDW